MGKQNAATCHGYLLVMTTDENTGPDAPQDRHSTTGTTANDTPVGRVSGDETGDTDESGGERRAGRPQDAHDGALRDE